MGRLVKWYEGASCAGYSKGNTRRFESLRGLTFSSLLDVGSGPCRLHDWLRANGMDCHYEAVDIRTDSLALCDCPTHTGVPAPTHGRTFDVSCLFGTCGFLNDRSPDHQKETLVSLIRQCIPITRKHIVFSGIRDSTRDSNLVLYSQNEFEETVSSLFPNYRLDCISDPWEWIAICSLPDALCKSNLQIYP